MQLEGLFDVSPASVSAETWEVDIELPDEWNVGLIVGRQGQERQPLLQNYLTMQLARAGNGRQTKA